MFDLKVLKLRLKYAWDMLFNKDFYKVYNKLDKYSAFIDILSKGRVQVEEITVDDHSIHRVYHCKVDYTSLKPDACFDFRRLCCLNPVVFPEDEYKSIEKLEVISK